MISRVSVSVDPNSVEPTLRSEQIILADKQNASEKIEIELVTI